MQLCSIKIKNGELRLAALFITQCNFNIVDVVQASERAYKSAPDAGCLYHPHTTHLLHRVWQDTKQGNKSLIKKECSVTMLEWGYNVPLHHVSIKLHFLTWACTRIVKIHRKNCKKLENGKVT